MQLVIIFALIFIFSVAKSATKYEGRYFLIPDDDQKLHLVDIQTTPRFVEEIDEKNVTFQFYTRENPTEPIEFYADELDILIASGRFDPSLPTLFNTHGWTGTGQSVHLIEVRDALLQLTPFNYIAIDWSGPSHRFYTEAIQYIDPLGDMIGAFINQLRNYYDLDYGSIGIMGHSLGGQLIGRVGYATNGQLGYIISLDPAYPSFNTDDLSKRLDLSDAQFVQVVHANSGMLGVPDSVGHADFHVNGGVKQPDCGADIIGTCSHFLIKDMVAESYSGTYVSQRCSSWSNFVTGLCILNPRSYWAGWPVDTAARGDYYLRTNGSPPFIIG